MSKRFSAQPPSVELTEDLVKFRLKKEEYKLLVTLVRDRIFFIKVLQKQAKKYEQAGIVAPNKFGAALLVEKEILLDLEKLFKTLTGKLYGECGEDRIIADFDDRSDD